jgi:hypothetical protein
MFRALQLGDLCLELISAAQVVDAARRLLEETRRRKGMPAIHL